MSISSALKNGIEYGFLDSTVDADERYKPALLVNDAEKKEKVLTSIVSELEKCDKFLFSVAFITEGGVISLISTLKELESKHIQGKIIASQYQNFTQPKALRTLMSFSNIELRIIPDDRHMHTKGYIFQRGNEFVSIIGSSNLTQNALCENQEWNIKLISNEEGNLTQNTISEFNKLFESATPVDDKFLEQYSRIYDQKKYWTEQSYKAAQDQADSDPNNLIELNRIKPNKMQVVALENLSNLRMNGKSKALLISATGTGKTYLAAFDVSAFNPKRCLFIIHREQIAKDAMRSFKNVMGSKHKMAVLSGNQKDSSADYLFSTIQTLSKENVLHSFKPEEFDYIIIDEVHRAGAPSYQKVIDYLKPKFTLGMTATPERSDDFDIFAMFDHNIAYEIRLQDAMAERMICPFHYFGVTELTVDGKIFDDNTEFSHLVSDERVKHILREANFYGYNGSRVKGLVFCSRKNEAVDLSKKFNKLGYKTLALSGENSQEEREKAVARLEQDELENRLDYIFTVDIFNEGVDIPSVNQIIMLRPTQSAIVFVQQLGRGLRLHDGKDYVVIIDFIGNYSNNYLIPIALSGDRTYNKDTVRKYVDGANSIIPGCSTINFDEITRRKIYEAIDAANFNDVKLIKDAYKQLKHKLGKTPSLMDFDEHGEIDPLRIFDNHSLGSYHKFLSKYEKEYTVKLSKEKEEVLEFVSKKFASGKRPHELEVLSYLLATPLGDPLAYLESTLPKKYNIFVDEKTKTNVVNVMTNEFATGSGKTTYKHCIFIQKNVNSYGISTAFSAMLEDEDFKKALIETVNFGLYRNKRDYPNRYDSTSFVLYQKYTYEDVCRLLNWSKGAVALNIGGYKYDKETKTYPVFINYKKDDAISDTTKYEDRFTSPSSLIAISKSGRTVTSDDVYTALHADELGVDMELFVRKNKDDKISKEFYYLGKMHPTGKSLEFTMKNTDKTAVEIGYKLDTSIREDLYKYIIE